MFCFLGTKSLEFLVPWGEAMYRFFYFYEKWDREFFVLHTSKPLTETSHLLLYHVLVSAITSNNDEVLPDDFAKIRETVSTFNVSLIRIWSQYLMEINSSVHATQTCCSKLHARNTASVYTVHWWVTFTAANATDLGYMKF